uniref:Peptidase M14 domain-containing protein n=1 Tax=Strongyloides stercoralis TaxID=6248 RepID=A0AAF5CU66_STRER
MEALLVEIKGCCSTGAESKAGNRNTEQCICDVDLNRSYPYKWNKIYNICIRFPGISKGSEHEVKSYTDFLVKNKNIIQGFVTLHSYEGFILYPWGYQKKLYTDDREYLYKLGGEMRNAIENISGAE